MSKRKPEKQKNPFDLFQNKEERTEGEGRRLRVRVSALMGLFCALLVVYLGVLFRLQVVEGETYRQSANVSIIQTETVDTVRGQLLDRYGRVLVSNRLSYQVTLDTASMGSARNDVLTRLLALCREEGVAWSDSFPVSASAPWTFTRERPFSYEYVDEEEQTQVRATLLGSLSQRLRWVSDATQADLTAQELMTAMCRSYGIALEEGAAIDEDTRALLGVLYEVSLRLYEISYTDYIFASGVDISFITKVKEGDFPGVELESASTRQYHTTVAAHVLGRVAPITAEDWPQYRDLGYPMDAYVGQDGVELAFESYLHGSAGVRQVEVDENGNILGQTWRVEPDPGSNVVLTLDATLQSTVEDLLARFVSGLENPSGAAGVVVDMTGGVLAMASYPTFDLSTFSLDYNDLLSDPDTPLLNRATMGLYSPGSTFKPLTAIAGLSNGTITPSSTVVCTGIYTYYPDVRPVCWIYTNTGGSHGVESVSRAITDSCNIFFYDVGRRMGIQTLVDYAMRFGLGQFTGIEIAEYQGAVAGPETSQRLGTVWYPGNVVSAAIGQENNQFTPLQLANYIATMVNGGNRYQVHLLKQVRSADDSQVLLDYQPVLLDSVEFTDQALAAVKKGMHDLSLTYSMARYFSSLPVTVGCKTGTAEVAGAEATAVFVCFAPYENPEVALCLVAEQGDSGGSLAALAAEILAQYFSTDAGQTDATPDNSLLH